MAILVNAQTGAPLIPISSNGQASSGGTGAATERARQRDIANAAARAANTPYEVDVPTYGGWSNLNPGQESGQNLQQTGAMKFMGTVANKPQVDPNPAGALRPDKYIAANNPLDPGPATYGTDSVVSEPEKQGPAPPPMTSFKGSQQQNLAGPSTKPWTPLPTATQQRAGGIPQPGPAPGPVPGLTPGSQQQLPNQYRFGAP